jgi:hypothetical protein
MTEAIGVAVPLSTDGKRQAFYASLLRFEPAMRSLREGALDRFVLAALIGSDEEHPLRVGEIQANLKFGPTAPRLRDQTVQETLDRLIDGGKVTRTSKLKRHAYCLTKDGAAEVGIAVESGAGLFDRVLQRVLRDLTPTVRFETATTICRNFLCECLAQFGRHFALISTGRWTKEDFSRAVNVTAVFTTAVRGMELTPAARESLEAGCVALLHSSHPEDQQLRLYLTQSYYFTQLLGFEGKQQFDPLADEAFRGSVFYLDTNVLLPAIVLNDANARMFEEMVTVAKTLGIALRVTRATMNEARRVAANRRIQLNMIVPIVPKDLIERTNDSFVIAYLAARERNQTLTPDQFMEPFDRLSTIVVEMGMEIDDRIEDEIIAGRDVANASQVFQEEAKTRGWGKSEDTLRHDVAHFTLVETERAGQPKTWFMTRDRTVVQAAARLAKDEMHPPFSFGLIAFLHSISPFITASGAEHSLAAMYSTFLTEHVPVHSLFDIADLTVLAETYEDAFATQPDRLIPALDYVKRRVLHGRTFTNDDVPKIALELRKFLARSADEQQQTLRAEAARLEAQVAQHRDGAETERAQRLAAEEAARAGATENASLRSELTALTAARDEQTRDLADLRASYDEEKRTAAHRRRRGRMIIGFGLGSALFVGHRVLINALVTRFPALAPYGYWVGEALRFVSVITFVAPAVSFVRTAGWSTERKVVAITIVAAIALAQSRLLDGAAASAGADILAFAALFAAAVVTKDRH